MSTVTARIPDETAAKLDELAKATRRSKSYLVGEALSTYLETQAWQIARIAESVAQADAKEFATDKEVKAAFAKWGVDIDRIDQDSLDT